MKVSIIISTFNRAGHLRKCLPSLLKQNIIPEEIIIIDDGSSDNTKSTVEGIREQYPKHNIKYIYNNRPESASCCLPKNIGLKRATGDLIIITEPEMLHIGNTIEQHLDWHNKRDNIIVSSGTIYFPFAGIVQNLTMDNFENPITITKLPDIKEWKEGYQPNVGEIAVQRKVSATYMASVRRKYLIKINGWEEKLDKWGFEDCNALCRLGQIGIECIADENIQAVHVTHGYSGNFEWFDYSYNLHQKYSKKPEANEGVEWGVIIK